MIELRADISRLEKSSAPKIPVSDWSFLADDYAPDGKKESWGQKCKNEYPVLPPGEKTAFQAVGGSIVWAFRRLKKPRSREMSARGYALHSV